MMNIENLIKSELSAFVQKIQKFVEKAESDDFSNQTIDRFSNELEEASLALNKKILKEYVVSHETESSEIYMGNELYRFKMFSEKEFLTQFGPVVISRKIFQKDRGEKGIVPLDRMWGMENEYATKPVREACLFSCSHLIPSEVSSILKKCSPFKPSCTALKNMVSKYGTKIESEYGQIMKKIREKEELPQGNTLVIGMDGANVMLNEKGKRKGRPTEQPKDNGLNSEKTAYKNTMVGCFSIYQSENEQCTRLNSTYISRMPEERFPTFKNQFEQEVQYLQQASKIKNKVIIMDGARGFWKYVQENPLYNDFLKLIDFFHATEHLSKACEFVFGKESEKGKELFIKLKLKLKNEKNGVEKVCRSLKYYQNKVSINNQKEYNREMKYFSKNKRYMKYYDFGEKGLPIGSGTVEAACKSIVKARLCRSGMRWSRVGGQNILNLRNLVKSGRWDVAWEAMHEVKLAA
jgi:hypothetical protein